MTRQRRTIAHNVRGPQEGHAGAGMSASNVLRLRDCERALKEIRALCDEAAASQPRGLVGPRSLLVDSLRAILVEVPE